MKSELSRAEVPRAMAIRGRALAPGRALGRLYAWHLPSTESIVSRSAGTEWARFRLAVAKTGDALRASQAELEAVNLTAEAEILSVHQMMLDDALLHERIEQAIVERAESASSAVERVLGELAELMSCSSDPVLAARASDFRDLAVRLESRLAAEPVVQAPSVRGAIVVTPELLPSIVMEAHELGALGFVVRRGTTVAHGAILASALGMPVLRVHAMPPGDPDAEVLLDADDELLIVDPPPILRVHSRATRPPEPTLRAERHVELWLSVTEASQLDGLDERLIDGIGLYRTEPLFIRQRERFPTEDEQYEAYRGLFYLAGERPVVVRTVDLGGDKQLAHMKLGPQRNPYLGLRAHRLFHYHPEIAVTQLRAILRAAAGPHDLRILFPMIESIEHWDAMRRHLDTAITSLERERAAYQTSFQLGVLIETPSAAWGFSDLLAAADFASVGTNDLVQYFFAAERGSANAARYYSPEHPVFLRLLATLAEQAQDAGKPISICGEIAGARELIPLIVGLGFKHLTMTRGRLLAATRSLGDMSIEDCEALARTCTHLRTASEVRDMLGMTHPQDHLDGFAIIDPICGMVVEDEPDALFMERDGRRVHFCSRTCRQRFAQAAP